MIKKLLLLGVMIYSPIINSQTIYEKIPSERLGESRELKIQLPRNYESNSEKKYPIVVVLDGDYLFEPVAGLVDYFSYWEDVPEMIIVGVNQAGKRHVDGQYDKTTSYPIDGGAAFFEFLGMDLMTYMDQKYRTNNFRIVIGHDLTANLMNYYLLKEEPLFDAYINLSPDMAPKMSDRITEALDRSKTKKWYYLATASDDIPPLKKSIQDLDLKLKAISNDLVQYKFENFEDASHYTLVGKAIPSAIENMFQIYRPISRTEYENVLLQTSFSGYEYLVDKYETINSQFGIEKQIRLNDFLAVYNAIEKTQRWEEFRDLSKLAEEHYPNTMLGTYFEARYEEETGNPKRAMKIYQKAYGQDKIAFLNIDFMLAKADAIKKDFGY